MTGAKARSARFGAVPAELRRRKQWAIWRRDGKQKIPYIADNPRVKLSKTDAAQYRSFEVAVAAVDRGYADGIAFAFTDDDPFAYVDLDDCFRDGELHTSAREIVAELDTYTERSQSGEGLHLIAYGELAGRKVAALGARDHAVPWHRPGVSSELAVVDRAGLLYITGDILEDHSEIKPRQQQLKRLADAVRRMKATAKRLPQKAGKPIPNDQIEEVAAALDAYDDGDVYRARCPVHCGESDNSLSFRTGDEIDSILFYCHAGCEYADVLREVRSRPGAEGGATGAGVGVAKGASGGAQSGSGNGIETDSVPRLMDAEPIDTAELLDDVKAYIKRYVMLPSEEAADLLALWVLHTHAFEAFWTTPYLRIVSAAPDSGKTLLMEVLAAIGRRGWHAVNPSVAVLYRKVDRDTPTLLLDEMDNYPLDDRRDALSVLNTGYKRGGTVDRCKENGDLVSFNAFCPKAYAGLDARAVVDTLLSRSITLRMERKLAGEETEMWIAPFAEPEAEALRSRCEAWAAQHSEQLAKRKPDLLDLFNREAEVWWPLLTIAEHAGGAWTERAHDAAKAFASGGDSTDDAPDQERLLLDIRAAFGDEIVISTEALLTKLNALDESPWGAKRKGEGLDARGLAKELRPFKIRPRTVRLGDKTAKGYHLDQFEDTFARYLRGSSEASQASHASQTAPGLEPDVTDVPDVTDIPTRLDAGVRSENGAVEEALSTGTAEFVEPEIGGDGHEYVRDENEDEDSTPPLPQALNGQALNEIELATAWQAEGYPTSPWTIDREEWIRQHLSNRALVVDGEDAKGRSLYRRAHQTEAEAA